MHNAQTHKRKHTTRNTAHKHNKRTRRTNTTNAQTHHKHTNTQQTQTHAQTPNRTPQARPYCEGPGRLGFYNNSFVARVGWWTSPAVAAFRAAFDDSGLIWTHRNNDLIFQTAAVRLLLPRDRWRRFADFSYQ